jgi:hypothetical protein
LRKKKHELSLNPNDGDDVENASFESQKPYKVPKEE